MKLCLAVNAFDTSYLLEPIISEIRNEVQNVTLLWQKRSYHGNLIDPEDLEEIHRLKNIGLVDDLLEFKPIIGENPRKEECKKRNLGITFAREKGFSHILNTDADEAYDLNQFQYAKQLIIRKGYSNTYCSYINYFKDTYHYLVYPFRPFVPFIHSTFFTYQFEGPAPGPTDPTRRIANPLNIGTYIFRDDEIRMCHLSWVRKDIRNKLNNWSAKSFFNQTQLNAAVERYENWQEGQNVKMLFNTPNNEVYVKKLEKKIHNFEVNWK